MPNWLYHFGWNRRTFLIVILITLIVNVGASDYVRSDGVSLVMMLLAFLPFIAAGMLLHFHRGVRSLLREPGLSFDEKMRIAATVRGKRALYLAAALTNVVVGVAFFFWLAVTANGNALSHVWLAVILFPGLSIAINVIEDSYLTDVREELLDRHAARERQRELRAELHEFPKHLES